MHAFAHEEAFRFAILITQGKLVAEITFINRLNALDYTKLRS
jgi:hypothetical protein